MAETVRDTYALAEKVATLTGRDALALIRWAACIAKSSRPDKVAIPLQAALRRAQCGQQLPGPDFPEPAVKPAPGRVFQASEEENWL